MYVLEELTSLSLQLQERFCMITRADKLIKRTIRVIATLKEKPGGKEREAAKASVNMNCHGINLNNKRIISIDRLQFITSIMNNLESRFFATVATHRKQTDGNEKDILADFEILNPDMCPEGDEKHLKYGEENIKTCVQDSIRKTSNQF
jgi:hypothetical protein